jgi:hypothetical protein
VRVIAGVRIACALGALSVGPMLLSVAPARAQADDKTILVQDFNAYMARCHPENTPPAASETCTNALVELTTRERKLGMTDDDLTAAGVRGSIRGGFRGGFH